jgi:hypothetical protein
MDVAELGKYKTELEKEISESIQAFEKLTGLKVDNTPFIWRGDEHLAEIRLTVKLP